MNNITATLIPYSEVPSLTMLPLQNWIQGFEFKPHNMRVAQATSDKGFICSVCYTQVADGFLITAMAVSPKATLEEKHRGGDAIDLLLEKQAQIAGVTKLLLITPGTSACEEVRTYTLRVPKLAALQTPSPVAYLN